MFGLLHVAGSLSPKSLELFVRTRRGRRDDLARVHALGEEVAWIVIPHEKLVNRLMQSSKDSGCFCLQLLKQVVSHFLGPEVRWIYVHNRTR